MPTAGEHARRSDGKQQCISPQRCEICGMHAVTDDKYARWTAT
jgi:hypothetical protein